MIRVVLFDLGLTLVDASDRPFPHVADALETIKTFESSDGKPLAIALVSDFDMPAPPSTAGKIRAIFDRYLAILDSTGLRPFFEPVSRHVTLSTHAGMFKPERKVFEKALARLKSKASLGECLFVTENHGHVQAVRSMLNMRALEFAGGSSSSFDFDDWLQAPALIAHEVDPDGQRNEEAAIRPLLRASHGFELQGVERSSALVSKGDVTTVHGTLWRPVGSSAGKDLADVHAPFSVTGEVTRGQAGQVEAVRLDQPTTEEVREAASFVRSLARHGQTREAAPRAARSTTHDIETDAQGRRRLVRKRFRAV